MKDWLQKKVCIITHIDIGQLMVFGNLLSMQMPGYFIMALSSIDGCLDDKLISITEDSLVLLYRENSQKEWSIYKDYIKTMQNVNDKKGNIMIKNLQKGQYRFRDVQQKLYCS